MSNAYNFKNLSGRVFTRLTVIDQAADKIFPSGGKRSAWNCVCDCGNELVVLSNQLTSGRTKSCGCLRIESLKNRSVKHDKSNSNIHMIWSSIKSRCYNKNNKSYERYGGRGIVMQENWINDFVKFYEYVGDKPEGRYSLDRIDNNGNYEEGNLRWATDEEQRLNQGKSGNNKYKYVCYHKATGKYYGKFKNKGKLISVLDVSEENAAKKIYLKYKEIHGEFPKYIDDDLKQLGLIQ